MSEPIIVEGSIAPIRADQLRNLSGKGTAAAGGAALLTAYTVPGVGSLLVDAATGAPDAAVLARAVAVAERILSDLPRLDNPEAIALLGAASLDQVAMALAVRHLAAKGV